MLEVLHVRLQSVTEDQVKTNMNAQFIYHTLKLFRYSALSAFTIQRISYYPHVKITKSKLEEYL